MHTLTCKNPLTTYCHFLFNDPPTTAFYTLSLHDALPISLRWTAPSAAGRAGSRRRCAPPCPRCIAPPRAGRRAPRSEEHTSELQSHVNLVCRLLLEKKKRKP